MKLDSPTRTDVIVLLLVLLVSLLVLPVVGVAISNNAAKQMHKGAGLLESRSVGELRHDMTIVRGPGYPIILASAFKILGRSVFAASVATRFFFSMSIVAVFLLARVTYGRSVGLLTAALVLSSYGVNIVAETIDTDIVMLFFLLAFCLLYVMSVSRLNRWYAAGAGLFISLGFLVKESSVLCLGIPLLYPVLAQKSNWKANVMLSLVCFGAFLIPLLLWGLYVRAEYGSFMPALAGLHPEYQDSIAAKVGSDSRWVLWLRLVTVDLFYSLKGYYCNNLRYVSPLAIPMLLSSFALLVRWLSRKRDRDLLVLLSLAVYIPAVLWTGKLVVRQGQTVFFFVMLYLPLAVFAVDLSVYLCDFVSKIPVCSRFLQRIKTFAAYAGSPPAMRRMFVLCLGFVLVFAQLVFGKSTWSEWTKRRYSLWVLSGKEFTVYGRFTLDQQAVAEWLIDNAEDDSVVMADGYSQEALSFFGVSGGEIPVFHPSGAYSVVHGELPDVDEGVLPVFFFTYSRFTKGERYRNVYMVYEKEIIEALHSVNPRYLVVSVRGLFFKEYFDRVSWADCCFTSGNQIVYRVVNTVKSENMGLIGVNDLLFDHVERLASDSPDIYKTFLDKLDAIDLSLEQLERSELRLKYGQYY